MTVTVIGAGNMGRGIGTRLVAGGNEVEIVDRDGARAQELAGELSRHGRGDAGPAAFGEARGDVVVLAIPYGAVAEIVAEYGDELAGKVVVDITNPVDFATFDGLVTPADSSAAEEIAKLLPDRTRIVKAFNTTFAKTLVDGKVAGQQLDVLIAGDDEPAKQELARLVEAGGLRSLDVGPLRRARELERLGFLHMALQDRLGTEYRSAVKFLW